MWQTSPFLSHLLEQILDLFPANLIVSDRYGDYLDKKEEHLDMLFFGRRRGWHLNKISLDK